MPEYRLKTGKLGEKVTDAAKKIEEKFTDKFLEEDENYPCGYKLKTGKAGETVVSAYQKIEDTVVGGYKAVEDACVGGYKKIENAFVDKFLEKVEDEDEE